MMLPNTITCLTKKLSQRHLGNSKYPPHTGWDDNQVVGSPESSGKQKPRIMSKLTANTPRRKTGNQFRKLKLSTMPLRSSADRFRLPMRRIIFAVLLILRVQAMDHDTLEVGSYITLKNIPSYTKPEKLPKNEKLGILEGERIDVKEIRTVGDETWGNTPGGWFNSAVQACKWVTGLLSKNGVDHAEPESVEDTPTPNIFKNSDFSVFNHQPLKRLQPRKRIEDWSFQDSSNFRSRRREVAHSDLLQRLLPPITPKFVSALRNPNLEAMIMQFAFFKGEAYQILCKRNELWKADLKHLYADYQKGYVEEVLLPSEVAKLYRPGVVVTGAQTPDCNGWYRYRKKGWGPEGRQRFPDNWQTCSGSLWYERVPVNGYYMHYWKEDGREEWRIRCFKSYETGSCQYDNKGVHNNFKKDDKINAKYKNGRWYAATIKADNSDGTYRIEYDDDNVVTDNQPADDIHHNNMSDTRPPNAGWQTFPLGTPDPNLTVKHYK